MSSSACVQEFLELDMDMDELGKADVTDLPRDPTGRPGREATVP